MCCLRAPPVREPAHDQRVTHSKSFSNCCRSITAPDETHPSRLLLTHWPPCGPHLFITNLMKENSSLVWSPSVMRQRGQRWPGFSCQGGTKPSPLFPRPSVCRAPEPPGSVSWRIPAPLMAVTSFTTNSKSQLCLIASAWGRGEASGRRGRSSRPPA